MKILVIGSGGREHAIIHSLSKCPEVTELFVISGSYAMKNLATTLDISPMDFDKIIKFCKDENIDFSIASMDDTLALGIVDKFNENNLKIFGPTKSASMLESSKVFSKKLMKKYNIPTAKYEAFENYDDALLYLKTQKMPLVIKADGLALGKGVSICNCIEDAQIILKEIMLDKKFGNSGNKVVIEEFMIGKEISILAFCDGNTLKPMVCAKDHKRAFDGDKGSNTGGMGTVSSDIYYTKEQANEAMKTIFIPTLNALKSENINFIGIIFFGLMITNDGIKVIEYNARFGDPETQVVLPRLKTNLVKIINACLTQNLHNIDIEWEDFETACVILASGGYPKDYKKGFEIVGLNKYSDLDDIFIYHAGTKFEDNIYKSNGGRVLGVMAKGDTVHIALDKCYNALKDIKFKNSFYRTDIGKI